MTEQDYKQMIALAHPTFRKAVGAAEEPRERIVQHFLDLWSWMKPGFVVALTSRNRVLSIPVDEFPRFEAELWEFDPNKYETTKIPRQCLSNDVLRRYRQEGIPVE